MIFAWIDQSQRIESYREAQKSWDPGVPFQIILWTFYQYEGNKVYKIRDSGKAIFSEFKQEDSVRGRARMEKKYD